jgi:hypothetical protein
VKDKLDPLEEARVLLSLRPYLVSATNSYRQYRNTCVQSDMERLRPEIEQPSVGKFTLALGKNDQRGTVL